MGAGITQRIEGNARLQERQASGKRESTQKTLQSENLESPGATVDVTQFQ